jgi:hypothetical protein
VFGYCGTNKIEKTKANFSLFLQFLHDNMEHEFKKPANLGLPQQNPFTQSLPLVPLQKGIFFSLFCLTKNSFENAENEAIQPLASVSSHGVSVNIDQLAKDLNVLIQQATELQMRCRESTEMLLVTQKSLNRARGTR